MPISEEMQQEIERMKVASQDFQQAVAAMVDSIDGLMQVAKATPIVGYVIQRTEHKGGTGNE